MYCLNCIRHMQISTFETGLRNQSTGGDAIYFLKKLFSLKSKISIREIICMYSRTTVFPYNVYKKVEPFKLKLSITFVVFCQSRLSQIICCVKYATSI